MKKLKPFVSVYDAMKSLDNGGRFFNIFTKANDGIITGAEVSTTVGLGYSDQSLMLFLQMSMLKMDEFDRQKLISKLSDGLKKKYEKYLAPELSIADAASKAEVESNIIITGIPKQKDSKTEFTGFIYVPLMAGDVTTMILVPLIDEYEVYDLVDDKTGDSYVIAHMKGKAILPEKPTKVGGLVKELKSKDGKPSKTYLKVGYQMDV